MRIFIILLFICSGYQSQCQLVLPTSIQGNWLMTDGSNTPFFGTNGKAVMYKNDCYRIVTTSSNSENNFSLQLANYKNNEPLQINILLQKDATINFTENKTNITLSKKRTFSSKYIPENIPSFLNKFVEPTATKITGIAFKNESQDKNEYSQYAIFSNFPNTVTLVKENIFTGDKEFNYCTADSNGIFEFNIDLIKPTEIIILNDDRKNSNFLVQPGANLLLQINSNVKVNDSNPDFDDVCQALAFYGDGSKYANAFNHFQYFLKPYNLNNYKYNSEYNSSLSKVDRKEKIKKHIEQFFQETLESISKIYKPTDYNQDFIKYLQTYFKYNLATGFFQVYNNETLNGDYYNRANFDSTDLAFSYNLFFKDALDNDVVYDHFFKASYNYRSQLQDLNYRQYTIYGKPLEEMKARVNNDYALLMPPAFIKKFNELLKNTKAANRLLYYNDQQTIDSLFDGDKIKATEFFTLFNAIRDEFSKEATDSFFFGNFKKQIANKAVRFVANLSRVSKNDFSEGINTFNSYRQLQLSRFLDSSIIAYKPAMDAIATANLSLGLAAINLKLGVEKFTEITNEDNWQDFIKSKKGKTVIICNLPQRFDKAIASRLLYDYNKIVNQYKADTNIVFIKAIFSRDRRDWASHLLSYSTFLYSNNSLENTIFVTEKTISLAAVLEKHNMQSFYCIYTASGQFVSINSSRQYPYDRNYNSVKLKDVLEIIKSKKTNNSYDLADYFLIKEKDYRDYGNTYNKEAWVLTAKSDKYLTYMYMDTREPKSQVNYDSVFNCLSFRVDSSFVDFSITLHQKSYKNNTGYNNGFDRQYYLTEINLTDKEEKIFTYDRQSKTITILNNKKKVIKKMRIAFLDTEFMVLEKLP